MPIDPNLYKWLKENPPDDNTQLHLNLARDLQPEKEVELFKASKEQGVPVDSIRGAELIPSHQPGEAYADIWQASPPLRRYLNESVNNAAVSKDDLPQLEKTISLWEKAKQSYRVGESIVELGNLRSQQIFGDVTPETEDRIRQLKTQQEQSLFPTEEGFFGKVVTSGAQQLPILFSSWLSGQDLALKYSSLFAGVAAIAGQTGPQAIVPEEAITVPVAAAAGYAGGAAVGAYRNMFNLEAGLAFDEFLDIRDENGDPIDPTIIKAASVGVGAINAGLEFVALKTLLKTIPGGERLFNNLTIEPVKEMLKTPGVRAALLRVAGKYGKAVSTEVVTEMAQEVAPILAGEMAKNLSEHFQGTFFQGMDVGQAANRVFQAGGQAFYATLGLGAPGTLVGTVQALHTGNQAAKFQSRITEIKEAIDQSKTKERSPDHAEKVLDLAGMGETVYFTSDGLASFLQTDPEKAQSILDRLDISPDVAKVNSERGIDTPFKMSKAYAQLDAEEFDAIKLDIKPAPGAYSTREVQSQAVGDELDRLGNIYEAATADEEGFQAELSRIKDQATQIGYGPEYSDAFGQLVERFSNRIALEGQDRTEFLRKINIQQSRFKGAEAEEGEVFLQDKLGFFSAVQTAVEGMDFNTIPATDLVNRINKTTGIKREEIEVLGVNEWLDGLGKDKVTKQQVVDFIKAGGVQIEESVRGYEGFQRPALKAARDFHQKITDKLDGEDRWVDEDLTPEELKEWKKLQKAAKEEEQRLLKPGIKYSTKFEKYQMEGEKSNYREVLLTLPGKEEFISGHFEEPNILAHFRLNDRIDSEGRKTLFVEEIQSDWHQKGRREGYKTELSAEDKEELKYLEDRQNQLREERTQLENEKFNQEGTLSKELTPERKIEIDKRLQEIQGELVHVVNAIPRVDKSGAVPQAPFKSSWPLLAFKRILRMAAEEGYDSVAWTPGEVQADRYDLSKQIDKLAYFVNDDNTFDIIPYKGTNPLLQAEMKNVTEGKLSDNVGKDLAKKIINREGKEEKIGNKIRRSFEGLDLKVGGEGLKGFYDKMLPNIVGKYVKKLDKAAKVGTTEITNQQVWSLPLTDKLKTEVMKGQALFQEDTKPRGSVNITNEQHLINLFEGRNVSTLIHETGHIFLKEIESLISTDTASDQLKKDYQSIRKWLKLEEGQQIETKHHEQFARGFEAYLMEGKAPTLELESAFARFRRWLTEVYKSAKALNVKLNNDIRRTFDRLLTINTEISTEAQLYGFTPATTEELNRLGVIDEDQQYIKRLIKSAHEKAENAMIKDRNRDRRKRLKGWREEATEIVNGMEIYQDIDKIIETGGLNWAEYTVFYSGKGGPQEGFAEDVAAGDLEVGDAFNIDGNLHRVVSEKNGVITVEGPDGGEFDPFDMIPIDGGLSAVSDQARDTRNLPDRKLIRDKGRSIATVADELGYDNGDALIEALFSTPKKRAAIQYIVNERIAERDMQFRARDYLSDTTEYGDYLALLAKYLRGPLLAERENLAATTKAGTPKPPKTLTREAYKAYAKTVIADSSVRDAMQTHRYLAAMKKAQQEQTKALLNNDFGKVGRANEKVRLNFALARESGKVRDMVTKAIRKARKSGRSKTIQLDFRENILSLIQRFRLADNMFPQKPEEMASLYEVFNTKGEGVNDSFPASNFLLNPLTDKDFRDLSVAQFNELSDAINFLTERGRDIRKAFIKDGQTRIEDILTSILSELETVPYKILLTRFSTIRKMSDATRSLFAMLDGLEFIAMSIGGYQNIGKKGVLSDAENFIFMPLVRAQNEKDVLYTQYYNTISPHIKHLQRSVDRLTRAYGKRIVVRDAPAPEILKKEGQINGWWTPEQIISVALNQGNEENKQRLLKGYPGLSTVHVENLMNLLTSEDMDAIQAVWDIIDTLYPLINEVHKRVNNFNMGKVEAQPFTFKDRNYRGGYYPIRYDTTLLAAQKIAEYTEADDALSRSESIRQVPATKSGFTKGRTGGSYPLKLSPNLITEHIRDTIQYITHAEAVRDIDRIIRDGEFKVKVAEKLGKQVYDMIRPALKHVARPDRWYNGSEDRAVEWLRGKTTAFILAWNSGVVLKQLFSTPGSMFDIGVGNYINGFASLLANPAANYRLMIELSPYMASRGKAMDRELRSLFDKMDSNQRKIWFGDKAVTWGDVVNIGFWPIRIADLMAVMPIWRGAYNKALRENGRNIEAAVDYADEKVRRSQPSAQPLDLSHWQRVGGWIRLFSSFQTFTIGKFGQRQRLHYRAWRAGALSTSDYVWYNFLDAVVPAVSMNLLFAYLWGQDPTDEDVLSDVAVETLKYMFLTGIPIAGQLFNKYGDPLDSPYRKIFEIIKRSIQDGTKYIESLDDEDLERLYWDAFEFGSFASGVPFSQVVKKAKKGSEQEQENIPGIKYLIPAPKDKQK